jgi:hypothetical protein
MHHCKKRRGENPSLLSNRFVSLFPLIFQATDGKKSLKLTINGMDEFFDDINPLCS